MDRQTDKHKNFPLAGFSAVVMVFFFAYFHRVNISVLAPDLMSKFMISGASLGFLASGYFYSYGSVQSLTGILVDRWKPRKVITFFAVLMGLGSMIFALAPVFWLAFLARVMLGFGAGGVFVPITWLVSRWVPLNKRAFVFSFVVMGGNTGAIMAAGPLGILIELIDWQNAILIATALTFILAVMVWVLVKDEPEAEATLSENVSNPPQKTDTKASQEKGVWLHILKSIFKERIIRFSLYAGFLSYGALLSFQGLWGVPFLIDVYGFTRVSASRIMTILPIGFVIGCFTFGRLLDTRFGRLIFVWGYVVTGVIYFIFAVATNLLNPSVLFLSIFILGFASAVFPYVLKLYSEILPQKNFGSAMGIVNSFPFFGGVLFQPLTGFVFDRFAKTMPYPLVAYRSFFLLLTITLVAATVAAFQIKKRYE